MAISRPTRGTLLRILLALGLVFAQTLTASHAEDHPFGETDCITCAVGGTLDHSSVSADATIPPMQPLAVALPSPLIQGLHVGPWHNRLARAPPASQLN